MIFAFQAYMVLFQTPKTKVEPEPPKAQVQAPNLLLGTTRENVKPLEIYSFSLGPYKLSISKTGARLISAVYKPYSKELITETEKKLNIFPLELISSDASMTMKLNFSPYEIKFQENKIIATLQDGELKIQKQIWYDGKLLRFRLITQGIETPFVLIGANLKEGELFSHNGSVFKLNNELRRVSADDIKTPEVFLGDISVAGQESRYYFKGFAGEISAIAIYRLNEHTLSAIMPKGELIMHYGAKDYSYLKTANLTDAIDFGRLKLIVKPFFLFLYWIYDKTGFWVISIFILTFIVRLLMFPLTYKSTVAFSKMAELAPKIQELKEKYAKDQAKFQEELIKLYQQAGFNPASGCLPILLQIPIFFALYKVLTITSELQLERFLWVSSLAEKDPYYILPILMGLTMVAQQMLTPNPDKTQNYLMIGMSFIFVLAFAGFPSGLVLYWIFNNIISLGQTYIIKKLTQPKVNKKGKRKN
ncbi:MAG: membrane protein insertase YidC [Aquificaceae bacterium]|nr:membrane protein insertase YidC [Aquificaceae bacterium]